MKTFRVGHLIIPNYITVVLIAIAIGHRDGKTFVDPDFKWSKNLIGLMMKIGLVSRAVSCFEGLNIIIHKESIVQD
jgi:hypothetical protein